MNKEPLTKCIWCGKDKAVDADYDRYKEGEGELLCWDDCDAERDPEGTVTELRDRIKAVRKLCDARIPHGPFGVAEGLDVIAFAELVLEELDR